MKISTTTILLLINFTGLLMLGTYLFSKKDGYAYIETYKVYESFVMKKQMQKQLETSIKKESERLDSLRINLKMASLRYEQSKDEVLKNAIDLKKKELAYLEQEAKLQTEKLADDYDTQIWAQINQYVIDYGKEHGQEIIFGASGNGSVMYGSEHKNITEKMITYVNKRHEGL